MPNIEHMISDQFSLISSTPPASWESIKRHIERFGDRIPDYLQLCLISAEIELDHKNGQFVRVWQPDVSIKNADAYNFNKYIPDSIPVGDTGSRPLLYMSGGNGWGVYVCGWGDIDREDAMWITSSILRLIRYAEGIENLELS